MEWLSSISHASFAEILTGLRLRALEKDRTRRYGSVSDLAADLQRHLNDLPVLASPPGTVYRMSKFVRRHRVGVTVAATLIALLVAFAATTGIQARRIARERDRANREAETAKAVNDFLQNDLLAQAGASAQARPDTKPDPDLKVRTALDRAAAGIEGKFEAQPLVEASIRLTIGKTYEDLGLYPEAERHMGRALDLRRRVLGEEDAEPSDEHERYGELYIKEAKYEQADGLLTKSLETARRSLGEQHPQTLTIMSGLGRLYMLQGKHSQAEPLYIKVLDGRRRVLGEQHPDTLTSMDDLASLYWRQGKYAQAEPVRTKVVELQRRVLGEEHPETLTSMNNLALLSSYQGKYAEAEAQFIQRPGDHASSPRRGSSRDDDQRRQPWDRLLSTGQVRRGRNRLHESAGSRSSACLATAHPETLTSMNNLGVALSSRRQIFASRAALRERHGPSATRAW